MSTILSALINLKKFGNNDLSKMISITNVGQPRINKAGDPLDTYIKDALCNSFSIKDPKNKKQIYDKELSHLGSQNNPPDIIIRGGDAIEVKKVEGIRPSLIALNSSTPKQKISSEDPMITNECKNCEDWKEKDLIYCIGNVIDSKVKILSFVYGQCYSAKKDTYDSIRSLMIEGIKKVGLNLSRTKELGRINQIDPLGRTDMRIRGMWQIKSPLSAFPNLIKTSFEGNMSVHLIIPRDKFESFPNQEKSTVKQMFRVLPITVPNPDNLKENIPTIHISFSI